MTNSVDLTSFIVKAFREFHQKLLLSKMYVLTGDLSFFENVTAASEYALNENSLAEAPKEKNQAQDIQKEFTTFFTHLKNQAFQSLGSYGVNQYDQALYFMACLTDEIFINLSWNGADFWENNLLESKLFQTHAAGSEVFARIEKLLVEKAAPNIDIGITALWTLGLGFKGRYRNSADQSQIHQYKSALYKYVTSNLAIREERNERLICSTAYAVTTDKKKHTLTDPHKFAHVFWVILVVYVALSSLVWHAETKTVREKLNLIQALSNKRIS